jgi:hypothetical protein
MRARRVGAVVLIALVLAGCTSGADPAEPGAYLIASSPRSVADFTVTCPDGTLRTVGPGIDDLVLLHIRSQL